MRFARYSNDPPTSKVITAEGGVRAARDPSRWALAAIDLAVRALDYAATATGQDRAGVVFDLRAALNDSGDRPE